MRIKETQLRNIISETIRKYLNESPLGLDGNDVENMGLKNPTDNYPVNYDKRAGNPTTSVVE